MKRALVITIAALAGLAVVASVAVVPASAATANQLRAPRSHRLLIIGASYTAGWGATNPRVDYAHRLAEELDWPVTVSAEPGAGYLSPGNNGRDSFLQQVAALSPTPRPALVIIQGGRNDIAYPAADEQAAVIRTLAAIRAKFDDPEIVMVGDIPASIPVAHSAVVTNELLGQVAADQHAVFIDPIREHWITAEDALAFRSPIPGHPNDAGHAYIARRLFVDLHRLSDGAIGNPSRSA